MAAPGETIGKVRKVTLTTAKRLSRTYLKNLQRGFCCQFKLATLFKSTSNVHKNSFLIQTNPQLIPSSGRCDVTSEILRAFRKQAL
jgi:hypothetical protein